MSVRGRGSSGAVAAGVRGGVHQGAARARRKGYRQERKGHTGDRRQERRSAREYS